MKKNNNHFLIFYKIESTCDQPSSLTFVSGSKRRITDKIQFLLASHERSHTCTFIVGTMDVPVQEVIFFFLIQFIFISEMQGKWVAVEREEILDTYYEQGKILNYLHNVCTLLIINFLVFYSEIGNKLHALYRNTYFFHCHFRYQ